jgi:hypothetical protein
VPKDWDHPKDDNGRYIPLLDQGYDEALTDWKKRKAKFEANPPAEFKGGTFEEWDGAEPQPGWYRPNWSATEMTHYQFYETVSEGTPLSPVFELLAELEDWLVEVGDSWGPLSREAARAFCRSGSAPSFIGIGNRLIPGTHAAGLGKK